MDWHVYMYGALAALFLLGLASNLRRGNKRNVQYSVFLLVWVLCVIFARVFPTWETPLSCVGLASAVIGTVCLFTDFRISRFFAKGN